MIGVSDITRQRSAKLPSGITEKMFRFAEEIVNGRSAADSYRAAVVFQRELSRLGA